MEYSFFQKKVGGEDLNFFQYEIAGKEKEKENVKNTINLKLVIFINSKHFC